MSGPRWIPSGAIPAADARGMLLVWRGYDREPFFLDDAYQLPDGSTVLVDENGGEHIYPPGASVSLAVQAQTYVLQHVNTDAADADAADAERERYDVERAEARACGQEFPPFDEWLDPGLARQRAEERLDLRMGEDTDHLF